MATIMTYLSAFGLAAGAGAKAFVPLLVLAGFHYTDYFELSERFRWIAHPMVIAVLAVLVVAEILVDSVPELGEYSDTVAYLPKLAAGFIAFAAATGTVDDSLTRLAASGVLGGGTAVAGHWLRNRIRRPFRDLVEAFHETPSRAASLSEAGVSATAATTAMIAPPLALLLLAATAGAAYAVARTLEARRLACVHCGQPIRPQAVVCPHCRRDQVPLAVA